MPWGRGSISDRSISEEDQCRNFMCTKRTHDIRTLLPKNFGVVTALVTIDDHFLDLLYIRYVSLFTFLKCCVPFSHPLFSQGHVRQRISRTKHKNIIPIY